MSKRDAFEVSSNAVVKVATPTSKGGPAPLSKPAGLPEDLDLLMKDTTFSLMIKFGEPSIAKRMVQGLREVTKEVVLTKISEAEAAITSEEAPDSSASERSTKLLQRILGYMKYYQQCPEIQQTAVQALSNISLDWTNTLKVAFVQGNGISILLQAMSVFSNSREYCIIFRRLGLTTDPEWNLQLFNRLLDERVLSTMIQRLTFEEESSCRLCEELIYTMEYWLRDGDTNGNISITGEAQIRTLETAVMWLLSRENLCTLTRRIGSSVRRIEDSGHDDVEDLTMPVVMHLEFEVNQLGQQVDRELQDLRRLCSDLPGNDESTVQVNSALAERQYQELMERCDVAQNQGGNET